MYWMVMRPFQKNRVELLKELRELVQEARLQRAERSLISERRFNRKMVLMRREIDRWLKELVAEEKKPVTTNETPVHVVD